MIPQLISHGDEERKVQPVGQTDLCGKEPGECPSSYVEAMSRA